MAGILVVLFVQMLLEELERCCLGIVSSAGRRGGRQSGMGRVRVCRSTAGEILVQKSLLAVAVEIGLFFPKENTSCFSDKVGITSCAAVTTSRCCSFSGKKTPNRRRSASSRNTLTRRLSMPPIMTKYYILDADFYLRGFIICTI